MKHHAFDPMLNCTDAAQYLCIHPSELRRMVALREIGSVRRGPQGHIKIRLSELNRWAEQHTTRAKRAS